MKMKIHYLSDMHLDFFTNSINTHKTQILFDNLIGIEGDVLILAGDLSHYTLQIKLFLEICSKNFNVVFWVSGNHEIYNISKKQRYRYTNMFDKINEIKEYTKHLKNVYFLDGDVIKYNGKYFGGAMGWYDCSYYYKLTQGMYTEDIVTHWKTNSKDGKKIPGLKHPLDLFPTEIEKVKNAISLTPDVMITHFCPVSEAIAISPEFKLDRGTGYYCFDGLHLADEFNPKFWVHGHQHDSLEFKIYNTTFLRNPVGYKGKESARYTLKSFEI